MHLRRLIHLAPDWLDEPSARRVVAVAGATVAGMALYGATVGYWRSPVMAGYVAVKMPLLIAATLLCNGLLNGLLGMLLGTGLGFRQSLLALLTSFSLAGLMLGSLAPVTLLMAWNAPPPDAPGAHMAHQAYLVTHTFLMGFAGVAANLHLHRLLLGSTTNRSAATVTLLAWLAGNCFLGAQFSYIFRPFFGTPGLKVEFLRADAMRGDFYTTVWNSLQRITHGHGLPLLIVVLLILLIPVVRAIQYHHNPTKP